MSIISPGRQELILATGSFKGVSWLHPQADGSLLYVFQNGLYRMYQSGQINLLAKNLASGHSTFKLADASRTVWGAWQDDTGNVYVAVFSEQVVRSIDRAGAMIDYYRSPEGWTPTHGVFDSHGRLWVLECSEKNEVRVVQATVSGNKLKQGKIFPILTLLWIAVGALCLAALYLIIRKARRQ